MTRLLYAASEALPFSKTGGLADVAHALPAALAARGLDVRLVTPAYRGALAQLAAPRLVAELSVHQQPFRIWEGCAAGEALKCWLVDCPALYDRPGTPYMDEHGHDFPDNAWRFGCFSAALAQLVLGAAGWRPDVLHLNDWQTGLASAWLRDEPARPRTVFTIHNLAYQGVFDRGALDALGLPAALYAPELLEFFGRVSFLKAGLVFADTITTVSPTYAREICTPDFGHGLDGLLRHRSRDLVGILNGIHDEIWDPSRDPHIARRYDAATVGDGKRADRDALQRELGLIAGDGPLVGIVSRLAHQKGIDQILEASAELAQLPLQFAILGAGDRGLEQGLRAWAAAHPGKVAVRIAHDEALAHRIEAGTDVFLMPSRYEPCGLNQMYSLRYGTVPVVRRVGGLADSVVDASDAALANGTATGIQFDAPEASGILTALRRALTLWNGPHWAALQRRGMQQDFSWRHAASEYVKLYRARA